MKGSRETKHIIKKGFQSKKKKKQRHLLNSAKPISLNQGYCFTKDAQGISKEVPCSPQSSVDPETVPKTAERKQSH